MALNIRQRVWGAYATTSLKGLEGSIFCFFSAYFGSKVVRHPYLEDWRLDSPPYLRRQKVTKMGQPLNFNFVVTAREAQTGLVSQGGTLERIRSWWTNRVTRAHYSQWVFLEQY